MMGIEQQSYDHDHDEFVEFDPTGRYGRYNEILGKGASKIVYRAFDEYEGIEVAWNQVKLNDFLQSPHELERLYCEIHLLKTLKHKHIMKFYTSWVDISKRNINFVTELFTSGTLRQYRQKHKRVHIRAVKHWCRQILKGLLYLHSSDPPIIHRDLKCDNIFINGNQGLVKIGDLGLAAILRKSYAEHCVGTPEFMAPEVYEEEYNELVDIYSFGMCVLEMVTSEYPYSECTHPAQIYMKVTRGMKPEALSKVKDPEVRQFVEKCLATVSRRLPARELLRDPFLQIDNHGSDSWEDDISEMCCILRQPSHALGSNGSVDHEVRTENEWHSDPETSLIPRHPSHNLLHSDGSMASNDFGYEEGWDCNSPGYGTHGINLFSSEDDEASDTDITIKGTRGEDGGIYMRLRIPDEEGHIQNIYFPFDIETDTAMDVANEMVGELDITEYEVSIIADMIEGEVASLAPEWKPDSTTEVPGFTYTAFCDDRPSDRSIDNSANNNQHSAQYSELDSPVDNECQFEERTYKVAESGKVVDDGPEALSTSQAEVLDMTSHISRDSHSDDEGDKFDRLANEAKEIHLNSKIQTGTRESVGLPDPGQSSKAVKPKFQRCPPIKIEKYVYQVPQELGRISSKRQSEQKDNKNQLFSPKLSSPYPYYNRKDSRAAVPSPHTPRKAPNDKFMKSFNFGKRFSFNTPPRRNLLQASKSFAEHTKISQSSRPDSGAQKPPRSKENPESGLENMVTAKNFYAASQLPSFFARARSLPQSAQGRDMQNEPSKVFSRGNSAPEEMSHS